MSASMSASVDTMEDAEGPSLFRRNDRMSSVNDNVAEALVTSCSHPNTMSIAADAVAAATESTTRILCWPASDEEAAAQKAALRQAKQAKTARDASNELRTDDAGFVPAITVQFGLKSMQPRTMYQSSKPDAEAKNRAEHTGPRATLTNLRQVPKDATDARTLFTPPPSALPGFPLYRLLGGAEEVADFVRRLFMTDGLEVPVLPAVFKGDPQELWSVPFGRAVAAVLRSTADARARLGLNLWSVPDGTQHVGGATVPNTTDLRHRLYIALRRYMEGAFKAYEAPSYDRLLLASAARAAALCDTTLGSVPEFPAREPERDFTDAEAESTRRAERLLTKEQLLPFLALHMPTRAELAAQWLSGSSNDTPVLAQLKKELLAESRGNEAFLPLLGKPLEGNDVTTLSDSEIACVLRMLGTPELDICFCLYVQFFNMADSPFGHACDNTTIMSLRNCKHQTRAVDMSDLGTLEGDVANLGVVVDAFLSPPFQPVLKRPLYDAALCNAIHALSAVQHRRVPGLRVALEDSTSVVSLSAAAVGGLLQTRCMLQSIGGLSRSRNTRRTAGKPSWMSMVMAGRARPALTAGTVYRSNRVMPLHLQADLATTTARAAVFVQLLVADGVNNAGALLPLNLRKSDKDAYRADFVLWVRQYGRAAMCVKGIEDVQDVRKLNMNVLPLDWDAINHSFVAKTVLRFLFHSKKDTPGTESNDGGSGSGSGSGGGSGGGGEPLGTPVGCLRAIAPWFAKAMFGVSTMESYLRTSGLIKYSTVTQGSSSSSSSSSSRRRRRKNTGKPRKAMVRRQHMKFPSTAAAAAASAAAAAADTVMSKNIAGHWVLRLPSTGNGMPLADALALSAASGQAAATAAAAAAPAAAAPAAAAPATVVRQKDIAKDTLHSCVIDWILQNTSMLRKFVTDAMLPQAHSRYVAVISNMLSSRACKARLPPLHYQHLKSTVEAAELRRSAVIAMCHAMFASRTNSRSSIIFAMLDLIFSHTQVGHASKAFTEGSATARSAAASREMGSKFMSLQNVLDSFTAATGVSLPRTTMLTMLMVIAWAQSAWHFVVGRVEIQLAVDLCPPLSSSSGRVFGNSIEALQRLMMSTDSTLASSILLPMQPRSNPEQFLCAYGTAKVSQLVLALPVEQHTSSEIHASFHPQAIRTFSERNTRMLNGESAAVVVRAPAQKRKAGEITPDTHTPSGSGGAAAASAGAGAASAGTAAASASVSKRARPAAATEATEAQLAAFLTAIVQQNDDLVLEEPGNLKPWVEFVNRHTTLTTMGGRSRLIAKTLFSRTRKNARAACKGDMVPPPSTSALETLQEYMTKMDRTLTQEEFKDSTDLAGAVAELKRNVAFLCAWKTSGTSFREAVGHSMQAPTLQGQLFIASNGWGMFLLSKFAVMNRMERTCEPPQDTDADTDMIVEKCGTRICLHPDHLSFHPRSQFNPVLPARRATRLEQFFARLAQPTARGTQRTTQRRRSFLVAAFTTTVRFALSSSTIQDDDDDEDEDDDDEDDDEDDEDYVDDDDEEEDDDDEE